MTSPESQSSITAFIDSTASSDRLCGILETVGTVDNFTVQNAAAIAITRFGIPDGEGMVQIPIDNDTVPMNIAKVLNRLVCREDVAVNPETLARITFEIACRSGNSSMNERKPVKNSVPGLGNPSTKDMNSNVY